MIESFAPGKLYIAGEYAVVEAGYPAILVAVDRGITITLKEALDGGSITAAGSKVHWTRIDGEIVLSENNSRLSYILAAMKTIEAYAKEQGKKLGYYHLGVTSQLESEAGEKYGLGSSAAVTVATVKALCKYYGLEISKKELFKLAALANLSTNKGGSAGDIAASAYGGWIYYTSFDRDWVLEEVRRKSLTQMLNTPWPNLSIRALLPPKELKLMVGWTGKPASTSKLVAKVDGRKSIDRIAYEKFLYRSKRCVEKMAEAFKKKDIEQIQKQIHVNRKLLVDLEKDLSVAIETPLLTRLYDIALKYDGYAKSSGAGGGDCGIAIFKDDKYLPQVIEEWGKAGIRHLPVNPYYG